MKTDLNTNLQRPITDEEIRTYEEDGVVWLPGILDPEWADYLARGINELVENPQGQAVDFTNLGLMANSPEAVSGFQARDKWAEGQIEWGSPRQLAGSVLLEDGMQPEDEKRGHYLSITGSWQVSDVLRNVAIHSPLPEIAATLMQSQKVFLYDDQVLVKPPLTLEKTSWHQDLGYDNIQGTQVCGVRVPAYAESQEMGLVQYLKGVHKSGEIYKVNFFISDAHAADDDGLDIPHVEGHEDDFDIVTFAPEPGDVVVHHLASLHGAGGNLSTTQTRSGVTVRYGGDDVTHKFRKHAPPQDLLDVPDGTPLGQDAKKNPQVWPR